LTLNVKFLNFATSVEFEWSEQDEDVELEVPHEDAAVEAEVEAVVKVPSSGYRFSESRPEGWESVEDGRSRNLASLANTQDAVPTQPFVKGTVRSPFVSSTRSVS